jgi:diacylglycerol kinase (ATP)
MKQPTHTSIARLVAAFKNSKQGFFDIWHREGAFRLETIVFFMSLPVAFWLASSFGQFALLIVSVLFLIIVEVLNSAIEATVDRIGLEQHELSRIAKDLGSLAVLLAALVPLGVWASVILARLGLITL